LLTACEQDQDGTVYVIEVTVTACEQDQDGTSSVLILLASCKQACVTYTIAVCTVETPDDGQRNCPKHVRFYSKNKFEKLMHLVGFIIRINVCKFVIMSPSIPLRMRNISGKT